MAQLEPVLAHDTPARALTRARIMKFLNAEKQLCQREGRTYRGLTYARLRSLFEIRFGYVPTIGNRVRELRDAFHWVRTEKVGKLNHVYPS